MYAPPEDLWRPVKKINPTLDLDIPENMDIRSHQDSVLIWDFDRWESIPLNQIAKRFNEDDPRRQDFFTLYSNIFSTQEGELLYFVKEDGNRLSFYHRLKKLNLRPLDPLIPEQRYRHFFLLLFFPLLLFFKSINRWEKISSLILWIPLSLWNHPFSALILLWAFSSSWLKEKKSVARISYWAISALLLLAIAVWGKSLWLVLLCLSHLWLVMASPGGNIFRDHTLLEPILLLHKRKFTPRSSVSNRDKVFVSVFLSLLFMLSLFSIHLSPDTQRQKLQRAENFIPDEGIILHHLSYQKSLSYLKIEDWQNHNGQAVQIVQSGDSFKDGISEIEVLPSAENRSYWLKSIPENSLESWALQIIENKNTLPENRTPWSLLIILSVLSWLTILMGLWQSSIDFDSQSYFVFKMKRRLKVA